MAEHPQRIAIQNADGRIVVMDSMTYVDARNFNCDVLIAASYFGAMPVCHWVLPVQPKGVIAQEAGGGKNMAGVSGLWALDAHGIPGAATTTESCRVSDGEDMYANGVIAQMNASAQRLGVIPGMTAADAANRMLQHKRPLAEAPAMIEVVHESANGRILALGSTSFIDDGNAGDVICAGSAFSAPSADYAAPYAIRGLICNDAGRCKDDSGIAGLGVMETKGVPAAAVSAASAEIGDALSTYHDGTISALNAAARNLGISEGMSAKEAALLML
jgi:uncharacterized protein YunC (DUF1805 family)